MIDDQVKEAREKSMDTLCEECNIKLDELDEVVHPIIDACTKDAISVCILFYVKYIKYINNFIINNQLLNYHILWQVMF